MSNSKKEAKMRVDDPTRVTRTAALFSEEMLQGAKVSPDTLTLDPNNAFEAVIIKMVDTHRRKARDYAGGGHPNANFYGTARQLALTGGHAVEALLATKAERLRVMLPQFWGDQSYSPSNEGIEDTLLDRAVYSVIALTIWREGGYESHEEPDTRAARFDELELGPGVR